MKRDWIGAACIAVALIVGLLAVDQTAVAQADKPKIIHDSEYYILDALHGEQWAAEDQDLDQKLADLRQKYGAPPNIIHIMFDDTPVGEVGVPFIQKQRGWETPNINRLAAEGINFTRMYTEPSCTPSRAAVMTGRHGVRNGMYNVGFPYEYGGLAASEVTIATCSPRRVTPPPSTASGIWATSKPATPPTTASTRPYGCRITSLRAYSPRRDRRRS
jgi:arylsulfatase